MATTTLTMNPQKITVSGTSEHDINFDGLLQDNLGTAVIDWLSGTSIQVNGSGRAITSDTGAITSARNKLLIPVQKGVNIRYKGGAGSETFEIVIFSE